MVNNTVFFTGVMYLGSVIQWSADSGNNDKFFPIMMLTLFSLTVLFSEIKNKG